MRLRQDESSSAEESAVDAILCRDAEVRLWSACASNPASVAEVSAGLCAGGCAGLVGGGGRPLLRCDGRCGRGREEAVVGRNGGDRGEGKELVGEKNEEGERAGAAVWGAWGPPVAGRGQPG
jgi:hypothetical protein